MDLLNDNVKSLFFKYFRATIASSMIMTIYTIIDTLCVGRYEGVVGTAAIACVFPIFSVLFAFGLLFGIGGSVLMAQKRGAGDKAEGDRYFSVGLIISVVVSFIIFIIYLIFQEKLLILSGAEGEVLDLAMKYANYITLSSPLFLCGQYFTLLIRNDGAPMFTTISAIIGGIFNIIGDFYFVFGLDMGIAGAGLATALGQAIAFLVLIAYLLTEKCTLKFTFTKLYFWKKLYTIIQTGGSNFIVDIAMGILAVIFNKQVMFYLGTAALGVYGVVSNLSATVQTFGYAVGESAQAIISVNYGAGKNKRIKEIMKYAGITAFIIGLICCVAGELFPILLVKIYMTVTPEIQSIAPFIIRSYFIGFIFLVFNVYTTYCFQGIGMPNVSIRISLYRGVLVSGILLLILPLFFGGNSIWFAVPISEAFVFVYIMLKYSKVFNFDQNEQHNLPETDII